MSALCLARRREVAPDGALVHVVTLTSAGLEALYAAGWQRLERRLGVWPARFHGRSVSSGSIAAASSDTQPMVVDVSRGPGWVRYLLYVHPGIRWFEGHFPGRPVLPGVVQVDWAATFAQAEGWAAGEFSGLSGVKFPAAVLPGDVVALDLEARDAGVRFILSTHAGTRSTGTLRHDG